MSDHPPKLPGRVIAGLVLVVVLDTMTHVAWKLAVAHVPEHASLRQIVGAALASPLFYVAMFAYLVQFYNWMRLLQQTDLSFAQPLTGVGYITVVAISAATLHEHVSAQRLAGVGLILAGVYFISRTPFRTVAADGQRPGDLPA